MPRVSREQQRKRRHRRLRAKLAGTAARPRLNVYRSLEHIYAQVVNDEVGNTLVAASTIDPEVAPLIEGKTKTEAAQAVGRVVAERAKAVGISQVVFDRGGFQYHGRVKALADSAREAGLEFKARVQWADDNKTTRAVGVKMKIGKSLTSA
ncbi:MAG: 50S ribosomal protein L18 [Anaerolineae bacterium]|nr:50S ribosomal protein L18 [Anaerolineae bacterium]